MQPLSLAAKSYIGAVSLLGLAILSAGIHGWQSTDLWRFLGYLILAMLSSKLKVSLPGITGTMSVSFLFLLIAIVELSFPEALVICCAATLTQVLWRPRARPRPVQVMFNLSSMVLAIAVSYGLFHAAWLDWLRGFLPMMLCLTAASFFVINTASVATIIALTERKSMKTIWQECFFWSFPHYLVGASITWLHSLMNRYAGWQASLLMVPVIYFIFYSYRVYMERLENEKKHATEMAELHMRTIEALALAIEAKDDTTHEHLQRVQVYAVEVGRELGMSQPELDALQAAAVLHDIGKLAVPEHIISKPGRLTPEEFEKMKIHPVVGAEILERVKFPYPVAPIVRSHHERWDGAGYPDGLKGEQIPLGARVLTAVDWLDALASDRQYRRALPLDEAMEKIVAEAGTGLDARVVEILKRRYVELEQMARAKPVDRTKLSTDVKIERGEAPAAGFEQSDSRAAVYREGKLPDFRASIAAARSEMQALFELTQNLGNSLSLDETISVLSVRLKRLIHYDCIAVYVVRQQKLVPAYVSGDNFRLFSSLEIPVGQGLSGWVAENRKAIVNGNPSVEPGYLNDPSKFSTLRSALAVPLDGVDGVVGVLSLYNSERDAFSKDHLRVLQAIVSKLAFAVENALRFHQVESSATTDDLTGLPNARSLFMHLDAELARARREEATVAVLVCDLNGFKQVNDRFGHLEGNRVLRSLGVALKNGCREYDYVARMGGDEFVLVLPGLGQESLEDKIRRLSHLVFEAAQQVRGEHQLSLSVGAAMFPEDGIDAEQLLSEADRRMYKAKQKHYESHQTDPGLAELAFALDQTSGGTDRRDPDSGASGGTAGSRADEAGAGLGN